MTATGDDQRSARPLRVLHCLWSGEIGGAERAIYQLVREQIQDPRIEPAILFAQARGHYWLEAQSLGCPVINAGLSHGHAVSPIRRIASAIRTFDLHHFHSAEPALMLSSILCAGATRVYTHRGGFIRYPAVTRLRYELTGLLLRRYFHGFSGNTHHGAKAAARLYRFPPERFATTYNGVAFELLTPQRSADAVRAELGLTPSEFVLGTAANLKPWKRIDRLVDLVAFVGDPMLRLLVVGDGPERKHLEAQAERLGVGSGVIFAGAKTHAADYMQIMDSFCLPSMGLESFGNAAVEAMAMGVPTLVFSDGGGMTEHIEDGQNGFVVRDRTALAEAVARLISDPRLRRQIGKNGSDGVRRRYTPTRAAVAYLRLYEKAIASKAARGQAPQTGRQ